ncbi:DNA polymerase I [Boudabousia liubingyangii]|uniref:DNA polymerase I n=1 Tax=Boudabousia liubingyangii TaxID=1921764 RepID=UPI00093CC7D9|nr:DNA polymerase I [Boudabousia liubingyangii]OKL47628.1 DNA polymerase I [Boudabousia liubingyangii]
MTNKLLVLDGHSIAFRAFYALREANFRTPNGQATGAVHGFLNMLAKMVDEEQPTHLAVTFDLGRESFRTREYAEYKGGRDETPEDFIGQVPLIKQFLEALNITVLTKPDFEADDIIATLATKGPKQDLNVLIASGDRDAFQLINDRVMVLWPGQSPSDVRHMDAAAVEAKYGVPPHRYPELAALTGEAADNLPGVPGVGPKTAAQWLGKYEDLEDLLTHADQIGGKRGQALRDHLEDVRRNRRLNRLVTDVELPVEPQDLLVGPLNQARVLSLCDELGFNRLRARLLKLHSQMRKNAGFAADDSTMTASLNEDATAEATKEGKAGKQVSEPATSAAAEAPAAPDDLPIAPSCSLSWREVPRYDYAQFTQEAGSLGEWLQAAPGPVALLLWGERSAQGSDVQAFFLADSRACVYLDPAFLLPADEDALATWLENGPVLSWNWKEIAHLLTARGLPVPQLSADVALTSYVADPSRHSDDIFKLVEVCTGVDVTPAEGWSRKAEEKRVQQIAAYQAAACALPALQEFFMAELELAGQTDGPGQKSLASLLSEVEIPIARVLFQMEREGIAVDQRRLAETLADFDHQVNSAQQAAFDAIGGEQVNLSSPKQLQKVLFEDLALPATKKTKTGYTTNAAALVDLYNRTEHPFLGALLEHREAIKLRQTVEGLGRELGADGRIHTTFQQTVTATGRLSSTDPNLQNIPARTDAGQRIRESFVPGAEAESILTADYSQIEMRIMAHSSGDSALIEAFKSGEDVHATMAALVFGVPADQVSGAQRSKIKAMSYGLVYGLSAFGLSQQLKISRVEAKDLMETYFSRFGAVKEYLDSLVARAAQDGFTSTILGRRRYLPDLQSSNRMAREAAQRAALNAPIQGSAADIIKLAMLDAQRAVSDAGLKSKMLLQVHDELVFEVAAGEEQQLTDLVRKSMQGAMELSVPLNVSVGVGSDWRAAAH